MNHICVITHKTEVRKHTKYGIQIKRLNTYTDGGEIMGVAALLLEQKHTPTCLHQRKPTFGLSQSQSELCIEFIPSFTNLHLYTSDRQVFKY